MLIVPDWLQPGLLKLPEYGMGYQKARVRLSTGGSETGFILNTEIFLKETETRFQTPLFWDQWGKVMEEARKEAQKSMLTLSSIEEVIPRPTERLRGVRLIALANSFSTSNAERQAIMGKAAGSPAKDAPITPTSIGEIFKRFSAYANDRRVTEKKGLVAGTYATTKEDADAHIKTGSDAVSRYALENKKPASNVFTITPPKGTDLQRGIVEPAYGEPGGGVEVIFVNGSPDGTVTGPVLIPER